jgi:hypothetical protein
MCPGGCSNSPGAWPTNEGVDVFQPRTSLVDSARAYVEESVKDLEGEGDMRPFLMCRSADGEIVQTLMDMPPDPGDRNAVADLLSAIVASHRATEAVFGSCCWAVTRTDFANPVAPSEDPDRVEAMMLFHATRDGGGGGQAEVIRENGRVRLGEWEMWARTYAGSRFGDAIRNGMRLGATLPPEAIEYIERNKEEAVEAVLLPMARAFASLRNGGGENQ